MKHIELKLCENCLQMTNHIKETNECLKCKANNAESEHITSGTMNIFTTYEISHNGSWIAPRLSRDDYYRLKWVQIEVIETILDNLNGKQAELCLFCGSKEYNGQVGIVHKEDCIIIELRKHINNKGVGNDKS